MASGDFEEDTGEHPNVPQELLELYEVLEYERMTSGTTTDPQE